MPASLPDQPGQAADPPLFRYLLLAAFLHGLILFGLKIRPPAPPYRSPPLQLQLRMPAAPPAFASGGPPAFGMPPSGNFRRPAGRRDPAASLPPNAAPAQAQAHMLIESAHRQLREESRQRGASLFAAPEAPREPPPGPLARALAPPPAEERLLPGGVLRITGADGRVRCLSAPLRRDEGSLTEALAVPSSCP